VRADAFIFHQHVVDDDEAARTGADNFDATNDGDFSVAARVLTPSVSHELKLFPECG
jgi:hypothetical protein